MDNAKQGVRRGKFIINGDEIAQIFKPVLKEIIKLVRGQIAATSRDVKAILLVGGFGESVYLRESLRTALGSDIEILVPANSWTAVVRGALMKGLARTNPSLNQLQVHSRRARKHYGSEWSIAYDSNIHSRSRRRWSNYHGSYRITVMHWYIKKGEPVREEETTSFHYHSHNLVSEGPPQRFSVPIAASLDPENTGAPMYWSDGVKELVKLKTDLSFIPEESIDRRTGEDGEPYYSCSYDVEMTNYSASTKYQMVYKGIRYNSVEAEYI
ncbi:hypothetical protein OEA41_000994 [Lepraria neglecta]|uniref:Uncharacterized protein n=1 Tax=Lepraria neglecta TaxID=209136 RepID=A0AAE0DQB2_9LECA|nr:hypothetical protein OEA41_000994 [Lepraria neglecta]